MLQDIAKLEERIRGLEDSAYRIIFGDDQAQEQLELAQADLPLKRAGLKELERTGITNDVQLTMRIADV